MSSKSLKIRRAALVAAAVCVATASSPSFAEYVEPGDFTIGADVAAEVGTYDSATYTVTLADDVTVGGKLTIADGVTIDLAGHKLTAAAFESANLVVNGDFDTDPLTTDKSAAYSITDWSYYGKDGGSTAQFSWEGWVNNGGGGLSAKKGNTWTHSNLSIGKYAAFLHGKGSSGRYVAQTLAGVPAGRYKWSFQTAARKDFPDYGFKFDFLLEQSGGTAQTLDTLTINDATKWTPRSGTATVVEAGTYALKFKINSESRSDNNGNLAAAVFDNVVLKKVSVITDGGAGTPGELHITGENGAAALNGEISAGGNLKLILHGQMIDGGLTVGVNTTLTGDLTVNGKLSLENGAAIDLNGHKLTVAEIENVSQNIVVNGNFETDPSPSTVTVPSGSDKHLYLAASSTKGAVDSSGNQTYIADWIWEGWSNPYHGAGLCRAGGTFVASTLSVGKYAAFLHGASPRYLGQELPNLPAGKYKWSFKHARRKNGQVATFAFRLVQNGAVVKNLWTGSPSAISPFDTANGIVTVEEAGAYLLWFQLTNSGDFGIVLDDVTLTPFVTITDSSTGAPGELRLVLPSGKSFDNDFITISGNLNFVKDGEGTFTCATEDLMKYFGDTYVTGGTYLCGLAGSQHPFGGGNLVVNYDFETLPPSVSSISGSQYMNKNSTWPGWYNYDHGGGITRKGGTSFDSKGYANGTYGAFLHGKGDSGRYISQKLSAVPAGEYKWSFRCGPRWQDIIYSYAGMTFSFNLVEGDLANGDGSATVLKEFGSWYLGSTSYSYPYTAKGTYVVESPGRYSLQFKTTKTDSNVDKGIILDDVVFERIPEVHIAAGATLDLNGKSGFGNYKFVGEGGTIVNSGADISESLSVSGVFAPVETTGSFGVELQTGTTLDFAKWTGEFPVASPAMSFVSGAAITVNFAGRTDLKTLATRTGPSIVEWDSPPDATFTLDDETEARCKIKVESSGLKLRFCNGFMIVVK